METIKKYTTRILSVLTLVGFLIVLQKYVSTSQQSEYFEQELETVKKETCYGLFQKRDVIKEKHSSALQTLRSHYTYLANTQFDIDWLGGTGDLQVVEELIISGSQYIRDLESQSAMVKKEIGNCNLVKN